MLIAAANEDVDQGPPTFWTKTRVSHMFCDHLDNWGYDNRVDWGWEDDTDARGEELPDDELREALWLLLRFLVDTKRLHPNSHPPSVLFGQLRGIDGEGYASENPRFWVDDDPEGDWYDGPTYAEAPDF